jgi:hypothetical protein
MFIRFTIPSDANRPERRTASGIFGATCRLAENGRFEKGERLWFEAEMEWFDKFLKPTRNLPDDRAVCWFRPDAGEAISRIWRLVHLVEGEGVPVRVYRSPCGGTRPRRARSQRLLMPCNLAVSGAEATAPVTLAWTRFLVGVST